MKVLSLTQRYSLTTKVQPACLLSFEESTSCCCCCLLLFLLFLFLFIKPLKLVCILLPSIKPLKLVCILLPSIKPLELVCILLPSLKPLKLVCKEWVQSNGFLGFNSYAKNECRAMGIGFLDRLLVPWSSVPFIGSQAKHWTKPVGANRSQWSLLWFRFQQNCCWPWCIHHLVPWNQTKNFPKTPKTDPHG